MGSQRNRQDWATKHSTHTHTHTHTRTHTHRAGPTMSISHLLSLPTTTNSMSWSSSIWSVHTGPLIVFHGQCVLHAIPWTPHRSFTIQRSLTINGHKEVLYNYLLPPSFYTQVYECGCVDYTFLKWSCWIKTQSVTNHPMNTYYVPGTRVNDKTGQRMSFLQGQDKDFAKSFHFDRCCHSAVHLWCRRSQDCLLPPHIILRTNRGESSFSDAQEAAPAPFCPHPYPADLNTLAAVTGCAVWEARNPRPLWEAHVKNTGSGSRGVQGQRPQIRPRFTQSGTEAEEQELAVGTWGLSIEGPVELSL